jgi:hypothetical protein
MVVDELTPGGPIGSIYTSTNSGASWTPTRHFSWPISFASSADGTKLVAAEGLNGPSPGGVMFTSSDSGTTWLANGAVEAWSSIACSADGRRIAAAIGGRFLSVLTGPVYISTDCLQFLDQLLGLGCFVSGWLQISCGSQWRRHLHWASYSYAQSQSHRFW